MDYLIQFQINIFALMILAALYLFVKLTKVKSFSKWWIRMTIVATAIGIILEPLSWIFDDERIVWGYYVEYLANFFLILMAPLIAGLLISYVDYRIFSLPKRVFDRWAYQQLTLVTFIMLLINIKYPIYFDVNPLTNGYSSGEFIMIHYALLGCAYLLMLYLVIRNIKKVTKLEAVIFVLFFLIPILGILVAIFNSKFHFSWTSIAFLLLVIYIFLETSPAEEDFLTRLYNRRSYERYLTYLQQNHKKFGLMVLDLDGFKQINDRYGHKKGDDVLVAFASILKTVFHNEAVIARIGGDEFMVVVEANMNNVARVIGAVEVALSNHYDPVVQGLRFSYGYEAYEATMSIDQLSIATDQKMYENKQLHHDMNRTKGS